MTDGPALFTQPATPASPTIGAKIEFVAPPSFIGGPGASTSWPTLVGRVGAISQAPSPGSGSGGAEGSGGASAFPANSFPQMAWIEGSRYKGYALSVPLKLFSQAHEECGASEQLFIVEHTMKYEFLTAPGANDSGSLFWAWGGTFAGGGHNYINAGNGAGSLAFGLGRRANGDFGWFCSQGASVTFIKLAWPAGDIRIPVLIQYRLWNARNGLPARIEVWLNGSKILADTFGGATLGLPANYLTVGNTFLHVLSVEAAQRLWAGGYRWACGPDNGTMV